MTFLEALGAEGSIFAINALLLLLATLASTFQCCSLLLSLLTLEDLGQRQYFVTRSDPGLVG